MYHRCGVQRRQPRQCDRIRAGHLRRGSVSRSIGRRARGVRVNEIGRAVECEVRRRGFSVIKGLSGHGVGRTIHEEPSVPNYYDPFQADMLTEGLVTTIEPMISAGSSTWFKTMTVGRFVRRTAVYRLTMNTLVIRVERPSS